MSTRRFAKLDEITGLVERFEDASLPRAEWDHATHLTIALWYLLSYDEHRATARMIDRLRAYNRAYGVRQTTDGGYHETVTLFWLALTRRFMERADLSRARLDLVNDFLATYDERGDFIYEHYSPERLRSWEARLSWVEPDRRPLARAPSES